MVPTLCGPVYSGNEGTTLTLEKYDDNRSVAESGGVDAFSFIVTNRHQTADELDGRSSLNGRMEAQGNTD